MTYSRGAVVSSVLAVLATVAVAAVGLWFAAIGTAVATVDPPFNQGYEIDIATMDDGDPNTGDVGTISVTFYWLMASNGRVEVSARSVDESVEAATPTFFIFLYCGARLRPMANMESKTDGTGIQKVTESGDEAACKRNERQDPLVDSRAYQVIEIRGDAQFEGMPLGLWTNARGGQRIARTPSIGWEGAHGGLDEVSPTSTATMILTSTTTESLGSVAPAELSDGEVVYDSGERLFGPNETVEFAAVQWASKPRPDGPRTQDLRSGIARWTQIKGQQQAQMFTLLAGVLLGVAASAIVEGLISIARSNLTGGLKPIAQAKRSQAVKWTK